MFRVIRKPTDRVLWIKCPQLSPEVGHKKGETHSIKWFPPVVFLVGTVPSELNRVVAGTMILQYDVKVRLFISRMPDLLMMWSPLCKLWVHESLGECISIGYLWTFIWDKNSLISNDVNPLVSQKLNHSISEKIKSRQINRLSPCSPASSREPKDLKIKTTCLPQSHCSPRASGSLCIKRSSELTSLSPAVSDNFCRVQALIFWFWLPQSMFCMDYDPFLHPGTHLNTIQQNLSHLKV